MHIAAAALNWTAALGISHPVSKKGWIIYLAETNPVTAFAMGLKFKVLINVDPLLHDTY